MTTPANPALGESASTADSAPARSDNTLSNSTFEPEALAPWRSPLSRALHRNRSVPFCRYLQLATLKLDGTPANRSVVFRGFLNDTNHLMFISDRRSEKTIQIQQNPNAEACWYFTKTREQFRLAGRLTLVTESETALHLQAARQQIWQNISDNARIQFAWPQPKAAREEAAAFAPPAPDSQTPPDTFTLLLLTPHSVDHLALRGEPQSRSLYQKGSQADSGGAQLWSTTAVNP